MSNTQLIENVVKKNTLYSIFNRPEVDNILRSATLIPTPWRGEPSDRSLSIKCDDVNDSADLIRLFGLNRKSFPFKFKEATEGDGQEARRIRTLHSSSLISLLCFYDVSAFKPLRLTVDGRTVSFTTPCFEVKNPVGIDESGQTHNSNIDVVLLGEDMESEKPVALFLESKFSEYLTWGKYSKISKRVYEKIYSLLSESGCLKQMGLTIDDNAEEEGYSVLSSIKGRTRHYAGGIKQMVSHFLGVQSVAKEYRDCGIDVYLGEILYSFPDTIDNNHDKFEDYCQLYGTLAKGLNGLADNFKVVEQCFTYQDVFREYDLDHAVKTFYSL